MWFKTKGIIEYNPYRKKLKRKPDWWCIVNIDDEISRYYRYQLYKQYGVALSQPSWGTHVSIIRGEKPTDEYMHLWNKYSGLEVEIEYNHFIRQSGDTTGWDRPSNYFFLDVNAPFLMNIRKEYSFPCNFGLHMTIGRIWNQ